MESILNLFYESKVTDDETTNLQITITDFRVQALVKKGLRTLSIVDKTVSLDDVIQDTLYCILSFTECFMSKNPTLTIEELEEALEDTKANDLARGYFAYINIRTEGYFKNLKAQIVSKEKEITTNNLVFFSEYQKDDLNFFEAVDNELQKQKRSPKDPETEEGHFYKWTKDNAKKVLNKRQYEIFIGDIVQFHQEKRTLRTIATKLLKAYEKEFNQTYSKELERDIKVKKIYEIIKNKSNFLGKTDFIAKIIYDCNLETETLKYFTNYISDRCSYNRKLHRDINLALLKEAKKLRKLVKNKCL